MSRSLTDSCLIGFRISGLGGASLRERLPLPLATLADRVAIATRTKLMKYLTNSELGGSGSGNATLAAKVAKIWAIATQNDNHSQH
jgi:hypothetical protein